MLPTYMNSSQQSQMRPQGHYHHHHQGFGDNNAHHMTMDAPCGYWPTPTPSPCYGNFPSYNNTYWPPYYPPQVPYHHPCCVNHSSFHPQVPPCYSHQPFPVYESAKDVPGKEQHCAKCSPYPKSNRGVVIEEHEPEIDRGEQSVRSSNFPYPIIWMPHENARIQEHGSGSHDQPPENMKVQNCNPKSWNGCFPFDERIMKSLTQNQQDRKKTWNGNNTVELPFDINKLKSLLQGQDSKIQEHRSASHDQPPAESKAPENMKIQKSDPRYLNGYFPFDESTLKSLLQNQARKSVEPPFDINKLKSSLQGQDGKEVQSHKNKEEQEQLPYPVFWIPSHGKREDIESSESNLKSFPSKNSNEGQVSQYKGKEGNSECNALSDAKENHQDRRKMQNENTMELPFDINKLKSLLQGQDGKEVQSKMNKEEQEQLPYPIFWIPSHGKGGSVEATESEERTNEGKEGNSRCNVLPEAEEKSSMRTIPVESHLQEPRNIPVKLLEKQLQKPTEETKKITKGEPVENTKKKQSSSLSSPKASRLPPVCLRVDPLPKKKTGGSKSLNSPRRKEQEETKVASSSRKAESKTIPEACNINSKEANKEMKESVESNSNLQEGANSTKEITEKKTFTDEEAARIIQSRYRGYDVRRWEPLKKLKEIATVREQMGDVEKRVQALEASSTDKHIEEKEIIVLEETVMNLLLKLDSVQGLHHSIREHRKSLARELSDIEDKLDSLKKSNTMMNEEVREQVEITSQGSDCGVNVEQTQLEEENQTVSDSKETEKVLIPSPEEQLAAEAGPGSSETETGKPETVAVSSDPEKVGDVETVLPINPVSDDGNGTTVMKPEEDNVMVDMFEEQSQLAEEKKMVSDSKDTEKVLLPSPEEQDPMSVMNQTDEHSTAEAEVETGLSETEICEADATSTTVPKKSGEAEITDEAKVMVENLEEEPLCESPQVVGNATEVSETESYASETEVIKDDNAVVENLVEPLCELASQVVENTTEVSENEDRKEDDETILPSEEVVELSELPVGVIDDEARLVSQDSSEVEITAMDSEVASKEETTNIETGEPQEETEQPQDLREMATVESETASLEETNIETSEPQEETEQPQDTTPCTCEAEATAKDSETLSQEVTTKTSEAQEEEIEQPEVTEETKRLMEENQRFKETMETLMKAGREQLEVISKLAGRVESLEKKLSSSQKKTKKRRTQIGGRKASREKQETKPMSVNSTDPVKETKYVV